MLPRKHHTFRAKCKISFQQLQDVNRKQGMLWHILPTHWVFSFLFDWKKKASPNLLRRTWRAHWAVGHPPNGRHVCMYGIREFSFQKTHNTNQVNETLLHGNTHFFMKYRWPIFDARHKLNLSITNLSKRCRIYRHNVRLLAKFHVELEYWTAR